MVQKKLNQKKPKEKSQEKPDQQSSAKNELNAKDAKAAKDENNNKCVEKKPSDFCPKQIHFVCQKFSDEQFNYVREQLIKLKDDKELADELDLDHLNEILDDHHLQARYMMRQRYDLDKQIEFIVKALKWRQENYISKIRKELFPKEPFELGELKISFASSLSFDSKVLNIHRGQLLRAVPHPLSSSSAGVPLQKNENQRDRRLFAFLFVSAFID